MNESFVKEFGLHVGDHLTVKTFAPRDQADVEANHYDTPHGPSFRFRIAAVVRTPDDVVLDRVKALDPASSYGTSSGMFVPSAFYDANHTRFLGFGDAYDVELDPGTTVEEFQGGRGDPIDSSTSTSARRGSRSAGRRSTPRSASRPTSCSPSGSPPARPARSSTALLLGAEQTAHESDELMLRSLGATRAQLGTIAALRTAPFAAVGAVLAVGFALALSGRFPIGVGHLLELDRGFEVNIVVLVLAFFVAVAFTIAAAFLLEWRSRRSELAVRRTSAAASPERSPATARRPRWRSAPISRSAATRPALRRRGP